MKNRLELFDSPKSNHITPRLHSISHPKFPSLIESAFICEAHSQTLTKDAKSTKISDFELLNKALQIGSDDIYSSSRYLFALDGANLGRS